ncbi:hypothetical protein ACWGE0_32005 [Lentzea sp. NPDC054927]
MSEEATSWGKPARSLTSKSVQAALGSGAADIAAASKAVAAATASGTFSVDPDVVDSMIKKLTDLQDQLDRMLRRSHELSQDTKLGDGYARVISQNNSQFGEAATGQVREAIREINTLKTAIEKSRASYQNTDQAGADSLKNLNGKS